MDVDLLHTLVTGAIWRAQELEARNIPAKQAWAEVSAIEEQLARVLPLSSAEGRIARRGAVRSALKAGDYVRADALARRFIDEDGSDEAMKAALRKLLQSRTDTRRPRRLAQALQKIFGSRTDTQAPKSGPPIAMYDLAYRSFYPRVLAFFLHGGVDRDEARDLTQAVFIRAWSNWSTISGEPVESLAPWIFTITRNLFLHHLRDGKAQRNRPLGTFASIENPSQRLATAGLDPLDQLMESERQVQLKAAIEDLPPRMKRSLLLYLEGYKYEQIAILMQTSIETVKSQLFLAKQRLKEMFTTDTAGRADAS